MRPESERQDRPAPRNSRYFIFYAMPMLRPGHNPSVVGQFETDPLPDILKAEILLHNIDLGISYRF